ncbi:MAG: hypothetical protein ACE5JX_21265, partial [Acidobacteriota bacterium]
MIPEEWSFPEEQASQMGERLAHPNRISDRAFSTKGRRVWVIMVIAPLLWLGLWLTVEMLYKDSISGRVQSQQMAEQMRPWMRVAADIGLMIWVCFWLRRAGLKVRDIGLKAEWLAREVIIG